MANKKKRQNDGSGDSDPDGVPVPAKQSRYNFKSLTLGAPEKSSSDKKSYRGILLPNGLRCLLISDNSQNNNPIWAQNSYNDGVMRLKKDGCCSFVACEKLPGVLNEEVPQELKMASTVKAEDRAAFCLIVQAGGADDPKAAQGMAHYTEHMLHYGSKKYPGEGKYWNFIQNFGNDVNAYTQPHTTTYQCSIHPNFLSTAVDIFSNIVSDPSFDEDCAAREINAIDSEFYLRKNNWVSQIIDVTKLHLPDTHPLNRFTCGNCTSLKEDQKDTKLKTHLKNQLQDFHKKHYVAKKMVLTIQSPDNLDRLQELVEEHFHNIPAGAPVDDSKNEKFKYKKFDKMYHFQGDPKLCLVWQFSAALWKKFDGKPLEVFDAVMNDGRENSLRHHLYDKGWIHDFISESPKLEEFQSKYSTLYILIVALTSKGETDIDQVVRSIFDYTDVFSNASTENKKKIWKDLKVAADAKYEYSGDGTPLNNTHYAARTMINSPTVEDIFTSQLLFKEFNPEHFEELCKKIKPEETLFIRYYSQLPNPANEYLPNSAIPYRTANIPQAWTKKGRKGGNKLAFPAANPFISNRFHIERGIESYKSSNPKMLFSHEVIQDLTIPKAIVRISFVSTEGCKSPHQRYMLNMLANHISMAMEGEEYCARKAGLYSIVNCEPRNTDSAVINFHASGFPEHIRNLLNAFLEGFPRYKTMIKEHEFNQLKTAQMSQYNVGLRSSGHLQMLLYQRLTIGDFRNEIDTDFTPNEITKLQFEKFISKFRSSMYIEAVMQGNISKNDVQYIESTLSKVEYKIPKLIQWHIPVVPSLPDVQRAIRIRLNPEMNIGDHDENNGVLNIYQVHSSGSKAFAIAKIVTNLMSGRVFQILRTQEQLGYSLTAWGPQNEQLPITFQVMIVTPAHKQPPCQVSDRIDNFLGVYYEQFLSRMTENDYVDALLKVDLKSHISVEEVRSWYQDNIFSRLPSHKNGNRFVGLKKLSLQVVSSASQDKNARQEGDMKSKQGDKKTRQEGGICNCRICKNIEWETGANPMLQYATIKKSGSSKDKVPLDYFITNIAEYQNEYLR